MSVEGKLKSYQKIEIFMERNREPETLATPEMFVGVEYNTYISDLWPVIGKCREIAIENQADTIKQWMAIARELYQVPEDITGLYQSVLEFIDHYNNFKTIKQC
jgi:hypothetical protein